MPDDPTDPARLEGARLWLTMHGLGKAHTTPLLATRLAARQRARLAVSILLALFLLAGALTYAAYLGATADHRTPLLLMTAVVVALVVGQSLVYGWVRRVDRRAAATLKRRAAHPGRLGWRAIVGLPRAALLAATFAGTAGFGIAAFASIDATGRYAAAILLIGVCGVAAGLAVQLRHLVTHPAVADDEASLAADAIMRVEDAREASAPTTLWCLPVVSVLATVPGWWTAAWCAFIIVGVISLVLITVRTPPSGKAARLAIAR